jgi:intracellular sulfur oxidation DsrE/DsrF family protein
MTGKLLIHISDRDKWSAALSLVDALIKRAGQDGLTIIIVADLFAGAVCLACSKVLREQMLAFVTAGHRLLICEDSLRFLNLRPESLAEFVEIIPNSLVEIAQLRAQGFQYVKV